MTNRLGGAGGGWLRANQAVLELEETIINNDVGCVVPGLLEQPSPLLCHVDSPSTWTMKEAKAVCSLERQRLCARSIEKKQHAIQMQRFDVIAAKIDSAGLGLDWCGWAELGWVRLVVPG